MIKSRQSCTMCKRSMVWSAEHCKWAGSQATEKEKLDWGAVRSVLGSFLYGCVLEHLGEEREDDGEKILWYEAQPLGEWCLEEESSHLRMEDLLL